MQSCSQAQLKAVGISLVHTTSNSSACLKNMCCTGKPICLHRFFIQIKRFQWEYRYSLTVNLVENLLNTMDD